MKYIGRIIVCIFIMILACQVGLLISNYYKDKKVHTITVNEVTVDEINEEEYDFSQEKYINNNEETGIIHYGSPTMMIKLENIKKVNPNLNMWAINLKLKDANQIKSGFSDDKFTLKEKEKTSDIAKRHNAVLAINGAAYGFNETSFVIRDKVIYRETYFDCAPLVIKENGDFEMFTFRKETGQELLDLGAMHTYDFGPDLIRNGEIVDYGDTWYKDGLAPRTAIGQKGPLEYVILVVDGRSRESVGMSCYDLAVELENRGCYWGYNLDGGGSTTLYFNGEVLNKPSDGVERKISDILYFIE